MVITNRLGNNARNCFYGVTVTLVITMENYGDAYNKITVLLINHHMSCTLDSRLLGTRRYADLIHLSAFS